jgi:hypothetical protein
LVRSENLIKPTFVGCPYGEKGRCGEASPLVSLN